MTCADNEVLCQDRTQCVSHGVICNGRQDCRDGSDELHCGKIDIRNTEEAVSRYPHSTIKRTRNIILKVAKIGVHIKEIRRSVKVEKRVLFSVLEFAKNSKRGRFLTSTDLSLKV